MIRPTISHEIRLCYGVHNRLRSEDIVARRVDLTVNKFFEQTLKKKVLEKTRGHTDEAVQKVIVFFGGRK